MPAGKVKFLFFTILILGWILFAFCSPFNSPALAQQPTGSVPTVTGTASGAVVALYLDESHPQEDVYSGPSSYLYPAIGVILAGQEMPAYGYSEDQNYIQIYYPGVPNSVAWVYAPFVEIKKIGPLPFIESPPTPTLISQPTSNIDPTLAAAFETPVNATRLPTFTPPAPLAVATFLEGEAVNRVPLGLFILGLGFIGALGTLISFLRGR
jgi:hypothetical protein